ncbi:MAG: transglutaminase domain-containing protein [bacterium]
MSANTTYLRLMLRGTFSLVKLLAANPGDLAKLKERSEASGERYVRPPRRYELPAYDPSMKIAPSRQRYLRPTRFCNPYTPQVMALAHSLGAFRLPPRQYAKAAFAFAKEKLYLEICPFDEVDLTLQRGAGTCFHLISVFIALCRAAGIPARYKMFSTTMIQAWRSALVDQDPMVKKWYDSLGYFMIEGEGEAFVDGRWTVAHVGPTAERQASAGLPITRFGEDALGLWFFAVPGTLMIMESVPLGLGRGSRFLQRIAPGSLERVNLGVLAQSEAGLKVLAAAGGVEAYDRKVRMAMGPEVPTLELEEKKGIVFAE